MCLSFIRFRSHLARCVRAQPGIWINTVVENRRRIALVDSCSCNGDNWFHSSLHWLKRTTVGLLGRISLQWKNKLKNIVRWQEKNTVYFFFKKYDSSWEKRTRRVIQGVRDEISKLLVSSAGRGRLRRAFTFLLSSQKRDGNANVMAGWWIDPVKPKHAAFRQCLDSLKFQKFYKILRHIKSLDACMEH
jgi:hypothetical protein